jgi:hypothetical protein
MVYARATSSNCILVSEVSNAGIRKSDLKVKFDLHAGLACRTGEFIFESFAENSERASKQEIDIEALGIVVKNLIAAPIFNADGGLLGVFELLNSDKCSFYTFITKILQICLLKFPNSTQI